MKCNSPSRVRPRQLSLGQSLQIHGGTSPWWLRDKVKWQRVLILNPFSFFPYLIHRQGRRHQINRENIDITLEAKAKNWRSPWLIMLQPRKSADFLGTILAFKPLIYFICILLLALAPNI